MAQSVAEVIGVAQTPEVLELYVYCAPILVLHRHLSDALQLP